MSLRRRVIIYEDELDLLKEGARLADRAGGVLDRVGRGRLSKEIELALMAIYRDRLGVVAIEPFKRFPFLQSFEHPLWGSEKGLGVAWGSDGTPHLLPDTVEALAMDQQEIEEIRSLNFQPEPAKAHSDDSNGQPNFHPVEIGGTTFLQEAPSGPDSAQRLTEDPQPTQLPLAEIPSQEPFRLLDEAQVASLVRMGAGWGLDVDEVLALIRAAQEVAQDARGREQLVEALEALESAQGAFGELARAMAARARIERAQLKRKSLGIDQKG